MNLSKTHKNELPNRIQHILHKTCIYKWAASWQNQQNECAPSEDSVQPGHPPSLIRVFAVRIKKAWVLSYPLSAERRLWSDWADAQADLSLRRAHQSFCWFCHEVAHIYSAAMKSYHFCNFDILKIIKGVKVTLHFGCLVNYRHA